MQSVSSRIWTRVTVFISYDDNHYNIHSCIIKSLDILSMSSCETVLFPIETFFLVITTYSFSVYYSQLQYNYFILYFKSFPFHCFITLFYHCFKVPCHYTPCKLCEKKFKSHIAWRSKIRRLFSRSRSSLYSKNKKKLFTWSSELRIKDLLMR